jgi:hypothetical protein
MEQKKKLNKLVLHQETVRNLTITDSGRNPQATRHTCVVSNCPFICTPAAGIN